MARKGIQLGLFAALAVVGLTALGLTTVRAQGLGQTSGSQVDVLISEVKLMRAALQEMTLGQSQLRVLEIQLGAQQSRATQISASLDSANVQLSAVHVRAREAAADLAADQALVARTADPNQRAALEQRIPILRQLVNELAREEAQLQSRISRLTASLTSEEQRGQALSSRLDGLVRK